MAASGVSVSLEEAQALLFDGLFPIMESERVPLEEALGRRVGEDIFAPMDQPPFDRSPLDGYAFAAADSVGATREEPVALSVVATIYAGGCFAGAVGSGQCVKLMTGAPIPKGCDCVIRKEETDEGQGTVHIYTELRPYQNFCYRGEDIRRDTQVLRTGDRVDAIRTGVLASLGYADVVVLRRPKVGLLATGDELAPLGEPLAPGKIYNSNASLLAARLRELGCTTLLGQAAGDSDEEIMKGIRSLLPECDLVITTGGVSVGEKDRMNAVVGVLGAKRLFWRIQMKPGSPALGAELGTKKLLCLSGNPFACLTTFEVLARPMLYALTGDESLRLVRKQGVMQGSFGKKSPSRRLVRCTLEGDKVLLPRGLHSSGALSAMVGCNAFIDIPAGSEGLTAGDTVELISYERQDV